MASKSEGVPRWAVSVNSTVTVLVLAVVATCAQERFAWRVQVSRRELANVLNRLLLPCGVSAWRAHRRVKDNAKLRIQSAC